MRFRLLPVLVVVVMVAGACSGDDSDSGSDDAPETSEPGTETTGAYQATIARTEHNVPHITADDLGSLGFGHGYAFAEDHLCSLADVVVQVNSEAASHHGERYLAQDAVYEALNVVGAARDEFDGLEAHLQDVIRGYAAGYNEYLSDTGSADVPGYCAGEDWVREIDEYDLAAYFKVLTLRTSVDLLIDFIFSASPPGAAEPTALSTAEAAWASLVPDATELGSNGWAIGPDRTSDGTTMLAGNPHFPWQGALRFYEVHLTVPGTLDVYGASLLGSPAVNIGFNDDVAWTHTVSAGNRFTAYTLDLVDGDPTRYVYGDEERALVPVDVAIDVMSDRDIGGIPWVNTIAASADGRIWYADTSAAPNLSSEAIRLWEQRVEDDLITSIALDNGVVLLDGSNPVLEWVDDDDARDPGLVPFDDMPSLERSDYVFNANDPYWLANPEELEVLRSPVFGRAEWPASPRTRMNATQLARKGGDSGADGLFSLDELGDSVLSNRVFTAEKLADDVVERCRRGSIGEACEVLDDWDRHVDLDSRGAVLWREFIRQFDAGALTGQGPLWAEPFDPEDPVGTPSGLAPPAEDGADAVVDALRAAVAGMESAGLDLDVPLGEVQVARRGDATVAIHGGTGSEGVTNVVGPGSNETTTEDDIERGEPIEGAGLTTVGYPIANGTSFVYVLEFTADGPRARSLLTYGQTGDPSSPFFSDQTQRFSNKDWKPVRFRSGDIRDDPALETYDITGPRS